jgi:diadenosine tetraphosphate (Ap4A) HIT family hydrolase
MFNPKKISPEEWGKLQIGESKLWKFGLLGVQHTLGCIVLGPKEKRDGSISDLSDEELIDLRDSMKKLEELMVKLFSVSRFNYSQMGNVLNTIHIHMTPRYDSPREFEGEMFTDPGYGHPVWFKKYEDLPEKETVFKLADFLRDEYKKMYG